MARLLQLIALLTSMAVQTKSQGDAAMVYDYDDIVPSTSLNWTPCFDNFTCARLEVPLDHSDESLGTTAIAFIKLAGSKATEDSQTIVFIPGGPGGSGIDLVRGEGARAGILLGDQYNFVSFDPRGVGYSGPSLDCFPGNKIARAAFTKLHATGATNVSSSSLLDQYYSASIYGEWCNKAAEDEMPKAYYSTTPAVARDLLAFTEAEAELAGKSASQAKLWAYAVSYGTVVGTTFASLFPDRVGRFVLDGVLNADQYYNNDLRWKVNQMDEAIKEFTKLCHSAGQDKCAFWGPSASNILERIDNILLQLESEPVPVSGLEGDQLPTLVTYSDLKALFIKSIYSPTVSFPSMAEVLHQVENGNLSALIGSYESMHAIFDAGLAFQCVDSYRRNKLKTLDDFRGFAEYTTSKSRYMGDLYPLYLESILCRSFEPNLSESMTFEGKVGAKNTSFPILFTSNTLDPITPIKGAHEMSCRFPGSKILAQEAIGHTVIGEGGSPCYAATVQAYLQGEVPTSNTTCPQMFTPFFS